MNRSRLMRRWLTGDGSKPKQDPEGDGMGEVFGHEGWRMDQQLKLLVFQLIDKVIYTPDAFVTFLSIAHLKADAMAGEVETVGDRDTLLKSTNLYREFQAEKEEILKHKWIESEKVGYDIGFERALVDWITRHRSAWNQVRRQN